MARPKGFHYSKETIEKIRLGNVGKKRSKITIKRLSESHIGQNPWNKGIPFSKESKKKMSESHKGHIPWNKGKKGYKLSTQTKERIKINNAKYWLGKKRPDMSGHKHPRFKGKTINRGYVYVFQPEHPFRDNKNYVKRSRLVMEKHLGRYLKPKEIVHHINEIKDDDKIVNLKLFPNKFAHSTFHHPKNTKFGHL